MRLIDEIRAAIQNGILETPFNAREVFNALGNRKISVIRTFLPKHRVGNPSNTTELFRRISENPVQYELNC